MKKVIKSRIFLVIVTAIIFSAIGYGVYAINASEITYGNTTVDQALNELYQKKSEGVQVATLTTNGASYTMQNDGYIIGTMSKSSTTGAYVAYEGSLGGYYISGNDSSSTHNISLYVTKGTIVTTRSDSGTYDLIVYEFK